MGRANAAEPVKLPFRMVSGVGPSNHDLEIGVHIGATWQVRRLQSVDLPRGVATRHVPKLLKAILYPLN